MSGSLKIAWGIVLVWSVGKCVDHEGEEGNLVVNFLDCCFMFACADCVTLLV